MKVCHLQNTLQARFPSRKRISVCTFILIQSRIGATESKTLGINVIFIAQCIVLLCDAQDISCADLQQNVRARYEYAGSFCVMQLPIYIWPLCHSTPPTYVQIDNVYSFL